MPDHPACLVIEDDPLHGLVLSDQLELMGYTSHHANSAATGLAKLEAEPFGLLLLDIRMPRMDGWRLARLVRASDGPWRSIPIIGVTALAFPDDIERTFASGMNGYIAKPYSFEDLRTLIDTVLREYPPGRVPDWRASRGYTRISPLCCYLPGRNGSGDPRT